MSKKQMRRDVDALAERDSEPVYEDWGGVVFAGALAVAAILAAILFFTT
jgi:hypothetical protein